MAGINRIVNSLYYALLYVLTAIGTLFLVVVWLPCFIYKQCLILFVKVFKKSEFGEIMDHYGITIADLGHDENGCVYATLKLKGNVTRKRLIEIVETNLINAKLKGSPTQQLRYPQLQQYVSSFMGYWFWKYDHHFNIENHVKETNHFAGRFGKEGPSHDDIAHFMLSRKLAQGVSPWDVTLLTNNDNKSDISFIVVRINHCLADGKSIFKLIVEGLGQQTFKSAKESKRKNQVNWFLFLLTFPFSLVRAILQLLLIQQQIKNHPFRANVTAKNYRCSGLVKFSRQVPIEKFKVAASKNGQAYTSAVIMATLAGALRTFGNKYQHPEQENGLPIICPLPKANHPETLKNHLFIATVNLPTNLDSGIERVAKCQHIFTQFMENKIVDPIYSEIIMLLVTTYVRPLRKMLPMYDTLTCAMSNLAGPLEEFSIAEFPCLDWSMSGSPFPMTMGVLVVMFSYKKLVRFCVAAQKSVMDENKCTDLIEMLEDELSKLVE